MVDTNELKVFFATSDGIFKGLEKSLEAHLGSEGFASGMELFWCPTYCDVLHIHWPEELLGWSEPSDKIFNLEMRRLEATLASWRKIGVKIVCTRHNHIPHTWQRTRGKALQDLVYRRLDGVIHLGHTSLYQSTLEKAHETVIPLSIFENFENPTVDRLQARRELGLPPDRIIIFCFGRLRTLEELELVLSLAAELRGEAIFVVASNLLPAKDRFDRFRKRYQLKFTKDFLFINRRLSNAEVQKFIAAADVCFSSRAAETLNSGPLIQYISSGRIAVGPRVGNLTDILESVQNPSYEVGDPIDAVRAVRKALALDQEVAERRNREFAEEQWNSEVCAVRHLDFYRRVSRS